MFYLALLKAIMELVYDELHEGHHIPPYVGDLIGRLEQAADNLGPARLPVQQAAEALITGDTEEALLRVAEALAHRSCFGS